MDPLTNVRRRLALLTSEGRVMSFFDNDILNAIQTREKNYVERMTNIFTSQFKNKYSSLVNELETEQKRVAVMDRQMDLLRSACDRRRQENNNQRRAFLLEIIGLKQSKDRTSQMRLNALLHKLEEGGSLGSEAETIDMDDFNDIEMNGGSRKQAKMIKDQHKDIMRYQERVKSLNQDVASGAKFAKQLKSERKRLREAVETMQGQLEEATTANSGLTLGAIVNVNVSSGGAMKFGFAWSVLCTSVRKFRSGLLPLRSHARGSRVVPCPNVSTLVRSWRRCARNSKVQPGPRPIRPSSVS